MARPPVMCQVIRNVMPLPIALQIFDELTAIAARVLPPRHLVVLVIRASTLRRPGCPRALDFDFRSAKPEKLCQPAAFAFSAHGWLLCLRRANASLSRSSPSVLYGDSVWPKTLVACARKQREGASGDKRQRAAGRIDRKHLDLVGDIVQHI